jgi:NAD(P)-dependent dehydrogenase (short-subunit alcohol dehydrogenase family)
MASIFADRGRCVTLAHSALAWDIRAGSKRGAEARMGKLDGKTVVVTGASRGIGAEIARVFAAEGGRVVCAARTLREGEHQFEGSLESTVATIKDAGGEATAVAANIAEAEDCERLVQAARDAYGPVDVLVNNAALTYFIPIKDYPLKNWLRSWSVNFHAPFLLSQLALQDMLPRKSGAIVNISSSAAIGPGRGPYAGQALLYRGSVCYGAEKAALERFTQGLAAEVYQDGVSVTCVSPSQVVPTPGTVHHRLVSGLDDPRGEPPELMAKAALLLATEPLDKVTGRVTYSQQVLKEFGWIDQARGVGIDVPGTGYAQT